VSTRMLARTAVGILAVATGTFAASSATGAPSSAGGHPAALPGGFKHLVVIYEENHSFDNLYGGWGSVNGQAVNGTQSVTQVDQNGTAYGCLLQDDVNLTSPPLANTCQDAAHGITASNFTNHTFTIDDYIKPADTTCPVNEGDFSKPNGFLNGTGTAGGCTRDLVHKFYQNIYQIDGGKSDRYVTGSDAIGLTMGQYDTKALPIYTYLHSAGAPNYVLADNFFQAAFGGSFLNHQWLIAARTPIDGTNVAGHAVLDSNGGVKQYPLYHPTGPVVDGNDTVVCPDGGQSYAAACGNWAVNTVQPTNTPSGSFGAKIAPIDDAVYPNIGDRLSAANISWNWFAGGWDDAVSGHPGGNFQFHHQPFVYFKDYGVGGSGRSHLQDETKFIAAAQNGTLPTVSFVKPYGNENEHPGYASEPDGSDHLVDLIKTVTSGPDAKDTLIVVTYDEFGGAADHVAPPVVDAYGPGTRIPALLIASRFDSSGVDHTQYDTTSILATIEQGFHLAPLSTRDAKVNPLFGGVQLGLDG
jgi:acid phosphatase